jgi:hypothetical protein
MGLYFCELKWMTLLLVSEKGVLFDICICWSENPNNCMDSRNGVLVHLTYIHQEYVGHERDRPGVLCKWRSYNPGSPTKEPCFHQMALRNKSP